MTDSIIPALVMLPITALAWAATFLLHSTLLIGCVWLLTRLLGMRAMAVQDKLWKVALTGALFTCTMQAGLGDAAIAPRFSLFPVSSPSAVTATGPEAETAAAARLPSPWTAAGRRLTDPAHRAEPVYGPEADRFSGGLRREHFRRRIPLSWQRLILLVWALGAAGSAGALALQLIMLNKRFRDRTELITGPVYRIFSNLALSRPAGRAARLTVSDRIPAPVAWGIRRPEVCLPRAMVREASPEQLKSVMAHELAHIDRRDQLWLLIARLVESIFFFQPLVRLARRLYQETAEFICDGEAVRQTGMRLPLARCLHEMARKRVTAPIALTIPGISGKGSPLNRRIEMILDQNRSAAAGRARWFGPLAAALILTFAFLAPGVTAGDDPPSRSDEVKQLEAPQDPAAPDPDRAIAAPRAERLPLPELQTLDVILSEPAPVPPLSESLEPLPAPRVVAAPEPLPAPSEPAVPDEGGISEAEAAAAAQAELEMALEEEEMRQAELEMAGQEAATELAEQQMAESEREMQAEAAAMAEAEREMELVEQELAAHELDLARVEAELAVEKEALDREEEALGEEDEEADSAGGEPRQLSQARREEIRRRHREIEARHREITRRHAEISREHRDAARRQEEALRQRRAVLHSEEVEMRVRRRGFEQALHQLDRSLAGELTDEQRERLVAIRSDIEDELKDLEEHGTAERTAVASQSVPRPEELE